MNQHTEGAMIAEGRTASIGGRMICISPDRSLDELGAENYVREAVQDEADIRRIVACVNLCAGFSTQYIEDITAVDQGLLSGVLRERQELREALKALLHVAQLGDDADGQEKLDAHGTAIELISRFGKS